MILFGFALIPLVLWPRWIPMLIGAVSLVALYELASLGGGGSHAFSLLYATLFEFTPNDIRSVPDAAPYLIPLRDQTIEDAQSTPEDLVLLAKQITDVLERYLHEKRGAGKKVRAQLADIERALSVEILERRPLDVFVTPLVKFQMATDGWASGADFGRHALLEKQPQAINRLHDEVDVLSPGLTGQKMDQAAMQQWALAHYDPAGMKWFTEYEKAWSSASIAIRLPDKPSPKPRWAHDFISMIPEPEQVVPGIPLYFLLAFAGIIAAMLIPGTLRWVQTAWLLAMLCTWYAATMVGVTNPRFRFAYEAAFYIYAVAAVVWAIGGIVCLVRRKRGTNAEGSQCIAS